MNSAIGEHVVRTSVLETCSRHGIAHDSELARQLLSEAEPAGGGRSVYVRASSGVSLDERVQELAKIDKFAADYPAAKAVVASTDMAAMSQNIDSIAAGKVTVK